MLSRAMWAAEPDGQTSQSIHPVRRGHHGPRAVGQPKDDLAVGVKQGSRGFSHQLYVGRVMMWSRKGTGVPMSESLGGQAPAPRPHALLIPT